MNELTTAIRRLKNDKGVDFFRRRSQMDDCFTGQPPGNAISIPAAPDVHEGPGQIQASAP